MELLPARHQELISLEIFEISKNKKFKTDGHFFNCSQRAANHLLRMTIINFDISKSQFTYANDHF